MNDPQASQQIDAASFRHILGHYPTGVSVVTAADDTGAPTAGMVVGTFTSVSLSPPLVAFLPDKGSSSWPLIERTGRFCVNVLGADQETLCRRFSSRGGDKFEGVEWHLSPMGNPILEGVVAWVDCDIEQVIESGDHFIVVGRVLDLRLEEDDSSPLTFHRGKFGQVGMLEDFESPDRFRETQILAAELFDHSHTAEYEGDISRLAAEYVEGYEHTTGSRSELVLKVLVDYLAHLVDCYRDSLKYENPVERLSVMIRTTLLANRDHRAASILYQSQRHSLIDVNTAELATAEHTMQELWIATIEQAVASGQFRSADPKISYFLMRDALFLVARWFREEGEYPLEHVAQEYIDRIFYGLSTGMKPESQSGV